MRKTLYDHCIEFSRKDLLEQWDQERNGEITPHSITYGSKQKVWWRCENGHHWQSAVFTRTGHGSGCPYCAGTKISTDNSLAALHPELLPQWHPTKNGTLRPEDVFSGSHQKVWWICEKGHEWQAVVKSRSAGHRCPVCSNRKLVPGVNDIATTHPELAQQWHPTKNGSFTPHSIHAGSQKHVWWRCEKGHEWQASISSRTSLLTGCPVCAGKIVVSGVNDLKTAFPHIAAQWHPTLNGDLSPHNVTPYSNKNVWWQCELSHSWKAIIGSRTKASSGCPYCTGRKVLAGFNDLATLDPKLAAQWHPALNAPLTPEMVTVGSSKKVWWQCSEGHVWKSVISSRAGRQKTGCPICAGKTDLVRKKRYDYILSDTPPKSPQGAKNKSAENDSDI